MVNKLIIIECGLNVFGIPDITIKSRKAELIEARSYIFNYLRYEVGLPLKQIGKLFNQDHTTVINSLSNFDGLEEYEKRCNKSDYNIRQFKKQKVKIFFNSTKKIKSINMNILERMAMVRDFNIAFEVPFCEHKEFNYKDSFSLRKTMLHEELEELVLAIENNDRVEIADALGDLSYIAVGGLLDITNRFDFSIDYKSIKDALPLKHSEACYLILNQINLLDKHPDLKQLVELKYSHLILLIEAYSEIFDIDLQPIFEEIHRSNMSKLDSLGKPIRREDGKILKSPNYFKPDIKRILNAQTV